MAGIEVANPFPVGVEEINAAGEYYEDLMAKSKLIGQGLANPEDYVGTPWYGMVRNRQLLRQLKEETGACPTGDGSGYEW
ncbi:MAG: hypothetical protein KDB03_26765 [Planctomycetales bacterium]|nr:hypothetical protein [Planctomycetales bacterium]